MQILLNATYEELYELLGRAVKDVDDFIDDDPERAGAAFIDTGCNHCTDGNTPAKFNSGLCWRHKATQLFKLDMSTEQPIPDTDLIRISEREVIEKAKAWANSLNASFSRAEDLLAAVSLLEAREQMEAERTKA